MRALYKIGQQRNVPTAGGNFKADLRSVPRTLPDGRWSHIANMWLEFNVDFKQAATTGVAVRAVDWPYLISLIEVFRHSGKAMHRLSGHQTRIFNALQNGGNELFPLQLQNSGAGDITSNTTGSAVSTQGKWWMPITFEDRLAYDKFHSVWCSAAFEDSGFISVTTGSPASVMDATLSLDGTGTNTCDFYIDLIGFDEPHMGIDFERYYIDDPNGASSSSIQLLAGDYIWFWLSAEKYLNNGAQDHSTVTNVDCGQYHTLDVPDGTWYQYALRYETQASKLGGSYYSSFTSGATTYVTSDDVVQRKNVLPLIWRGIGDKLTHSFVTFPNTQSVKVTHGANWSGATPGNIRYGSVRVLTRDENERKAISSKIGLGVADDNYFYCVQDGRKIDQARSKFVPIKLCRAGSKCPDTTKPSAAGSY